MRFTKLLDAVTQKLCGFGVILNRPQYYWSPRYDGKGEIYMWIRNELPNKK